MPRRRARWIAKPSRALLSPDFKGFLPGFPAHPARNRQLRFMQTVSHSPHRNGVLSVGGGCRA